MTSDLAQWTQPPTVHISYYIDDVLLTSDSLKDLEILAPTLVGHLGTCVWAVNTAEFQGPDLLVKFLGVVWLGKIKIVLEAVIYTIQVYLQPTTVLQLLTHVGFWYICETLLPIYPNCVVSCMPSEERGLVELH